MIDRAVQVHGARGLTDETPLAAMLAMAVVRKREQDALRREMIERRIREISEE